MSLQSRLNALITAIGADVKAATTPYTAKQRFQAGILSDTAPGSDSVNGLYANILIKPTDANPNADAIIVKRPSSTGGWADATPYGAAQALLVLSSSTQDASDTTGDGISGSNNNPVLARLDAFGGLGVGNGIHVAVGLRNTGGALPTQGIWIDPAIDAVGIVIDNPNTSELATTPTMPFWMCRDARQAGTPTLAQVDSAGVLKMRAQASGSQFLGKFLDSSNVLKAAIKTDGIATYDDDETTQHALISPGTNPASGSRLNIAAGAVGVIPLVVRGMAAGQTADVVAVNVGGGSVLRVNKTGYLGIKKVAAPADADVANSELMMWWDATNFRVTFKGKTSAGVVKTGTVQLA